MDKQDLLNRIHTWDNFPLYKQNFENLISQTVAGLDGPAAAFFAAAATNSVAKDKKILYIAPNEFRAKRVCEDLNLFLGGGALVLEKSEYMFYNALARSHDADYQRLEVLSKVAKGDFKALVVSCESLLQFTVDPEKLLLNGFSIKENESYDTQELAERLTSMGYVREPNVTGKRQFSIRGDIFDIFPVSSETAFRLDFFDDVVDTIKVLDVDTQRSGERAKSIEIRPESEAQIAFGNINDLETRILASLDNKLTRVQNSSMKEKYRDEIEKNILVLKSGQSFLGMDRFLPFIIGRKFTIFDYVKDPFIFVEEAGMLLENTEEFNAEHIKLCETLSESMCILDEMYTMFMSKSEVLEKLQSLNITNITQFSIAPENEEQQNFNFAEHLFHLKAHTLNAAAGNDVIVKEWLKNWNDTGLHLVISSDKREHFERTVRNLESNGELPVTVFYEGNELKVGFEFASFGFVMVSECTFITKPKQTIQTKKKSKGDIIDVFSDIKPGDYVVHDLHGIGIFEGIEQREYDGAIKDYVVIRYAAGGKILLPSLALDTIHKWIGGEDQLPRISTLGGKDWQREKEKVKQSLRDYVEDLAKLYAKRESMRGFAFSKDTEWQRTFEQNFEFEPTSEQLECTNDIKSDMESIKPMERLLCGDVGFGKTEVAFRAAFKAVMDGKQVAFLVPTTILAEQHYRTAIERFQGFPIEIDYLCRFRTKKEADLIKKKLSDGKIDIVVGTHTLVKSKDIKFKDLGLLIIDEEQRFGVLQKEKIKMDYPGCDILYLSATPIPRTLNMSLSKIRDISLITEPPKMRNPVQTYVFEMKPQVIKNAIYREMARHGQVFYLYNRVQLMEEKLTYLQNLIPEARIGVANGQMPEAQLEKVMKDFINREYDVLLCSTIIESGLDIPNANTIIVENGERLGLAQLYQIRGRVGRSDTRAYAYITYPSENALGDDARKRLDTIREFTEFGSGFKVAMRDLEIRGAGSMLGERQHGDVSSIGYDLYTRMLNDMITEATGGTVVEKVSVNVEFEVSSYIPGSYISDPDTRMELYRKIAAVETKDDEEELIDELLDRFPGDVPDNLMCLVFLSRIKYMAGVSGISSVTQKKEIVEFDVESAHTLDVKIKENMGPLNTKYRRQFNIMAGEKRIFAEFKLSSHAVIYNHLKLLTEVKEFLQTLSGEN